nr:MAG TPA: hypothetical protein [Caudoviricetes sp.]
MGYVKQGFKDGDVLNASQLVKIEQGIQDNETETAKKAERIVFSMEPTGIIADDIYSLRFTDGKTYNDVVAAVSKGKEVSLQINGNRYFENGTVFVLPFSGITAKGEYGFSYSATTTIACIVISVAIAETISILVCKKPIISIDDGTEVKY